MKNNLSRVAKRLLGLAGLMGTAGSAFAAGNVINLGSNNVWTVYAFGNAQTVADSFRALANFSASTTFQSLISLIAVLGVLGVGMAGGFNAGMARRFIGYVVSVFLVCYVFFGVGNGGPLVVNVEIIDSVDMTWKAPVTVPAVVGIPASIISSAGYKITQAIEASFALPDALKMSNGAPFNLAAAMLADASTARITDPNLASSLAYYVQDCFTVGVAQGALVASSLITSTNFLNDIKYDNKAIMVNTLLQAPVGTPGVVSCSAAWDLINNAVNAQGTTASDFLKSASAWAKTPAMSVVNAAADSTAQWVSNSGITDGGSMVKQSAILSAFRGAYSQASAQTGNSDFLTGLAISQQVEAQHTSWITGAEIFNKSMGYMFAIIQVFVYAITPLVLMAALVPGLGFALLKNFSQILLWLAIWQPMLSIVNFIVISMQQAELGGILNSTSGYGFSLTNMGIISEKTSNLRAAASFVGTMVPALAWAMVKGSVDFSRVIGSAVGENFAQGAANTMTTGNYSLNQASMDSFTANKHSTAATGAWGEGLSNASTVGSRTTALGGTSLPETGEQRMNVGVGASEATNAATARGAGAQVGQTGSEVVSATSADAYSHLGSHGTSGGSGQTSGGSTSVGDSAGMNGQYQVWRPDRGGPSPSSAAPAAAATGNGTTGTTPTGVANTPANTDAKPEKAGRGSVNATAGGQLAAGGTHATTHNNQENFANNTSGGSTQTGSTANSGGTTGSTNRNASTTNGSSTGENMNVTGIAPVEQRAQAMAAYMRPNNPLTTGGFAYLKPAHSDVGDKVDHLHTPGAVQADVKAEQAAGNAEKKELTDQVDALDKKAHVKKAEYAGRAEKELAADVKGTAATAAPASVGAGSRFLEVQGHVAGDIKEKAKEGAHAAVEKAREGVNWLKEHPDQVAAMLPQGDGVVPAFALPMQPPHQGAPSNAAQAGAGQQPTGQQPNAQQAGQRPDGQPGARDPHGNQPHGNPADDKHHGQPVAAQRQGNDAQKPAHSEAGNPAPGQSGQPAGNQQQGAHAAAPRQTGPAKQPDGHGQEHKDAAGKPTDVAAQRQGGNPQDQGKPDHDKQKPAEHSQAATTDQQRQQEQRQQELAQKEQQERQLAAAAAVSQALQASQNQQQPQGQPVPAPAEAPSQLAQQQQQQPQQQLADATGGAPNPFSGDKSSDSSSQLQGQVQLAEQRAERLDNQRRGVEGVLSSAEGRKATELPELISQARDMMRNA